jgi:hypothetical protein
MILRYGTTFLSLLLMRKSGTNGLIRLAIRLAMISVEILMENIIPVTHMTVILMTAPTAKTTPQHGKLSPIVVKE